MRNRTDMSARPTSRYTRRGIVCSSLAAAGAAALLSPSDLVAQDKVKIVWSTWGSPEELTRYEEFNAAFMERHPDIALELVPVPSYDEYHPKILTQIGAGKGPDVFYVGDDNIGKFVESGILVELTEMLAGTESQSKPEEFFDGLWGAAKTDDGKIFGVTNDCNPQVLWYNKKVLAEVGIKEEPIALLEAGDWNLDAFQQMAEALREEGKHGAVLENWFADTYSLIRANGGVIYDDSGAFVAHENPASVEALRFLYDNIKSKAFTASNYLPEGQGAGALFISGLAGFRSAGRWFQPTVKDALAVEDYDIVTWPTSTGQAAEPSGVATSFLAINKNSDHQDAAFAFLTEFVSKEGQLFRLQGGGNAVPSIKGADEVVMEEGAPTNAHMFLDAREQGFVEPAEETRVPGLPQDILKALEPIWLGQGDFDETLANLGKVVNEKLADAAS